MTTKNRDARRKERLANDPEYRSAYNAKKAARRKERCTTDPEYRERCLEARRRANAKRESTPESRAKAAAYQKARLDSDPELRLKARAANNVARAKRSVDPEYRSARNAAARKRKAKKRAAWLASPEYAEKRAERRERARVRLLEQSKQKYREDPRRRMRQAAAGLMSASLRYPNQPKVWHKYFSYTMHELRAHLESRFVEGMSWETRAEWHIDHIHPVGLFEFEAYRDPVWEDLWALKNLQPLWGADNSRKNNKLNWLDPKKVWG